MSKLYSPIRIIFADDHEVMRDGFHFMMSKEPGIEIVGEAKNGEQLVQMAAQHKPDVIITDIEMPVMNGIEATKEIVKLFPAIGIIAFSMYDETHLIVEMLRAGALGYIQKSAGNEEIIEAVKTVYKGHNYYCRETDKILSGIKTSSNPNEQLFNEREITIIKYVCDQLSNAQIAEKMNLSRRTIEKHREKIMEKIDANNIAGIVLYAIKHNIINIRK